MLHSVSIADNGSLTTNVNNVYSNGLYTFRLTNVADNSFDDVSITVNAPSEVFAGNDRNIAGASVTLSGYVRNIGIDNSIAWSQLSGPNSAIFQSDSGDNDGNTSAVYSGLISGTYVFKLAEIQGISQEVKIDTVTITVQ